MSKLNTNDLISDEQMKALTGTSHKEKQIKALQASGIRYSVKWDGWPTLTWEAYNRQLANGAKPTEQNNRPNLQAI